MVLKKPHLRDGDNTSPSILEHLYPVQLAQLVTVTLLLLFMLFILLSIRSTLSSLKHQVKRISRLVSVAPSLPTSLHGTMDREKVRFWERDKSMLEKWHSYLFPGCTSYWKWKGGKWDVCRWEGARSSLRYVVHPWIGHNMRDYYVWPNKRRKQEGAGSSLRYVVHPWICHNMNNFLEKLNNKEQRRVSKIEPWSVTNGHVFHLRVCHIKWLIGNCSFDTKLETWLLGCYCQIECSCTERALIYTSQNHNKKSYDMGKLFCNVLLCFSMKQIRILRQINLENEGLSSSKNIYW